MKSAILAYNSIKRWDSENVHCLLPFGDPQITLERRVKQFIKSGNLDKATFKFVNVFKNNIF